MRVVSKHSKIVYEVTDDKEHEYLSFITLAEYEKEKKHYTPLIEQITSLDEYQKLAARTLPDLTSIYGGENKEADIIHMNFGVNTEKGEILDLFKKSFAYRKVFDKVNLLEEVCDIMWYEAGKCTIEGNLLSTKINLNGISFYGGAFSINGYPAINDMYFIEVILRKKPNIIIQELVSSKEELFRGLTNNINKLIIRYPDKFTNEDAVNRNLDSERNQLEQ